MFSRWLASQLTVLWSPADGSGWIGRSFGETRSHAIIVSGRACPRVDLAARLDFPSSVTGISASLQALASPGASTFFFTSIKTEAFDIRECGSPARATFIVDSSGTLRYMAAHRTDIPRCFILQSFSHSIVKFLLVKECDRDPSAGAGFPTLRPHWTCQSDIYAVKRAEP